MFYYPKLSNRDYGYFRIGGPGLANCMFFAAKAYVACLKNGGKYISPTWRKFSIGPYLRHEKDKRTYTSLFKDYGISGFRKIISIIDSKLHPDRYEIFSTLGNYFGDLQSNQADLQKYFQTIVNPEAIKLVPNSLNDKIAIHVRLGDYLPHLRIPMNWYVGVVNDILKAFPKQQFLLFSDGRDEELKSLLEIPGVKKVFFGNAFADMWAISKCKLLIASDSTFSAWGAFLGRVPIIFNKRHFPPVYDNDVPEIVLGESTCVPEFLLK